MEQIPSGWMQDRVPEFKSTPIPITINDPWLSRDIVDMASLLKMEPVDLCRKIVILGVIIANTENDSTSSVVERDQIGNERKVNLMSETYSIETKDIGNVVPRKNLVFSMPRVAADELMEIANRHHTTIDVVLKQIVILGIKAAKSQTSHEKSYIIRDQQGNDQQISLL